MSDTTALPQKKNHKVYSLVFCRKLGEGDEPLILLGLKKRGFGEGKMNGYGGKIDVGETIVNCAKRELLEESTLVALELEHVASLEFDMPAQLMLVECFLCSKFEGTATETEEMSPLWVRETDLPTLFKEGRTWADDSYWLPLVLQGKQINGRFRYIDNETIDSYSIFEPIT